MKNLIALMSVVAAGFVAAPNADANPYGHQACTTYVSGHTSCGCPIYTSRTFSHYDCHGHPVFIYQQVPVNHRCRHTPSVHRPAYNVIQQRVHSRIYNPPVHQRRHTGTVFIGGVSRSGRCR